MHFPLITAALLASAGYVHASSSKGCGQQLPSGVTTGKSHNMTIKTSDGLERSYLLHLPAKYDAKTPAGLIWSFHGRGKNSTHQESISKLSHSKVNPNHIVVYPQGISTKTSSKKLLRARHHTSSSDGEAEDSEVGTESYGESDDESEDESSSGKKSGAKTAWQGDPDSVTDDVKFTMELLESISGSYCVEEDKIFASGMSNGGGFVANVLACDTEASTKFAAFASASGAYYQNDVKGSCDAETVAIPCNNSGAKIALITTAGGKDKTIPWAGGSRRKSCLPSIPHFATAWAERDGLSATNVTSKVSNSDVEHYSLGTGEAAGMVQSYYIPTMGHQWPTGDSKTYVSATKVFLEFFADWNLTTKNAVASSLPASTYDASSSASQAGVSSFGVLGLAVAVVGSVLLI